MLRWRTPDCFSVAGNDIRLRDGCHLREYGYGGRDGGQAGRFLGEHKGCSYYEVRGKKQMNARTMAISIVMLVTLGLALMEGIAEGIGTDPGNDG